MLNNLGVWRRLGAFLSASLLAVAIIAYAIAVPTNWFRSAEVTGTIFPPTMVAAVNVDPDALNLRIRGKWITCYIELPEGYNVSDTDIYSIRLNDTIPVSLLPNPPVPAPTEIGDYDNDTIPDLMVKFNRTELTSHIYHTLEMEYGNVSLTISGNLTDGTLFEGSDTIKVMFGGDVNCDGLVSTWDLFEVAKHFGALSPEDPCYNPDVDLNYDETVDVWELLLLAENYGATVPPQPSN